jgi:hypothetical protein
MFGLQKYTNKIFDINWNFPDRWKEILEAEMAVDFKKENDYFKIINIRYTFVDLLLALENMDFNIKKIGDIITITILNY